MRPAAAVTMPEPMKVRARIAPLILPFLAAAAISGTVLGFQSVGARGAASTYRALLQRHSNVVRTIETSYVREIAPETLARATVSGMLAKLDPHSNLFVPRNYRQMRERQQGGYVGLGIRVQQRNGLLTVVSPFEGTPAYRLGIRAGDVISRIEGADATRYSMDEAVNLLRGPRGTPVSITITRPGYDAPPRLHGDPRPHPAEERALFLPARQTGQFRKNGVCCGSPTSMKTPATNSTRPSSSCVSREATGLVVDLRHNPGGLLNQAIAVSNVFLPRHEEVVSIRGAPCEERPDLLRGRPQPPTPICRSSCWSPARALRPPRSSPGAVQDHDRGLIVGENTYGKGAGPVGVPVAARLRPRAHLGRILHPQRAPAAARLRIRRLPRVLRGPGANGIPTMRRARWC